MDFKRLTSYLRMLGYIVIIIAILVVAKEIGVVQLLFPEAGGVKATIVVDTEGVVGPLPTPWRYLAQGGEESTVNMLAGTEGQVRALEPEYIRLDHLYDFYGVVERDASGALTFNWARLDEVVTSILNSGAKPFLSLSYMPPALGDDLTGSPRDYGEWQTLVRATVQHFSGSRNIADVYYEIWNEPDLFGGWRTYGGRNYLTLYQTAVAGAENATGVQPFKIGGPATTGNYKNWFDNLLEFTLTNNVRLDFYSWHRYSRDPGVFYQDVEDVRSWLTAFPQRQLDLELIISEWGHDSEIDAGYDGMYAAAHTLAVAIEMVNRVDKAFVFEIKDGPDPNGQAYWGRWGLLNHTGAAKSRYYALRLLTTLSQNRLGLAGTGTWVKAVAAADGPATQVLLVNYDRRAKHQETVPVTFTNLQSQTFTLTQTFLNGKTLSEEIATTASTLTVDIPLAPLSILLLKLTPQ